QRFGRRVGHGVTERTGRRARGLRAVRAGPARLARLVVGAALAEGRGLAGPLTEEVQLGAAHLAVAQDLDLVDARAVDLERPLDSHARGDAANRDGPGDAAAAQPHHDALEDLDALA